jgi:hypothetical protein
MVSRIYYKDLKTDMTVCCGDSWQFVSAVIGTTLSTTQRVLVKTNKSINQSLNRKELELRCSRREAECNHSHNLSSSLLDSSVSHINSGMDEPEREILGSCPADEYLEHDPLLGLLSYPLFQTSVSPSPWHSNLTPLPMDPYTPRTVSLTSCARHHRVTRSSNQMTRSTSSATT